MRYYLCISHGAFHNRSYVMKKIPSGCTGHFRLIIHGIYGLKVIKKLFLTFPSVFEKSLLKNLPKITQQKKIWHLCAQHKENWQWNSHKRMSVSKETQICPQLERSSESTAWKVIFPFWPKAMGKSGLYLIAMGIALFYPQQVYSASETAKNTFRCKLMNQLSFAISFKWAGHCLLLRDV